MKFTKIVKLSVCFQPIFLFLTHMLERNLQRTACYSFFPLISEGETDFRKKTLPGGDE